MKIRFTSRRLRRLVFALIGLFLFLPVVPEHALSDSVDTLDLQLQWVYPLVVTDLKLVDFDQDGISEILVGFYSDSGRAGILDPVTQTWVWQGPGFNGHLSTVAAGDRNNDGFLDIVCGGQLSDTSIGYIELFDGPYFDSVNALSGFDNIVLSADISARGLDSLPKILLGTYEYIHRGDEWWYGITWTGHLYVLDGRNLTVENVASFGSVREILSLDINGDTSEEVFFGKDYYSLYVDYYEPIDNWRTISWVSEMTSEYSHHFTLYDLGDYGPAGAGARFDALAVGSFDGGNSYSIVASGHTGRVLQAKLVCWNESTTDLGWSLVWSDGTHITGLAVCDFDSQSTSAICATYQNGLIELKKGDDGSNLAVVPPLHSIYHLELGNLDQDSWLEMCVASGDSLYVYETEFWPTNLMPVVSDIPGQTVAEGESFASIGLDEYVTDPDNRNSAIMWTHWGETELLVDITGRVATITVSNPEWNGAENIWFKACDPRGLCDSNEAIFAVTAVNDTPAVTDIPDQTISEDHSFASISLDDYVTDPDDNDSVMIWTHWGETVLLVDMTERLATITVPNPEWGGIETIWFKACDPGELCDSNEAAFAVTAVNDTPAVSNISDQTIVTGESFASVNLDDYVTDPDDHDSAMTWTHWGEVKLSVDITDRVATITLSHPEWEGLETIWFKACDPAALCDSDEATFTSHPKDFCLLQNYPNPFNPNTNIRFSVPVASNVTVAIYNVLGQKIRSFESRCEPGTHTFRWDGKNSSGEEIASGVYLYKLSAGSHQETRKMVLLR